MISSKLILSWLVGALLITLSPFTDAEVITVALMQSVLGVPTLKKTFNQIRDNYGSAFPKLCSYK